MISASSMLRGSWVTVLGAALALPVACSSNDAGPNNDGGANEEDADRNPSSPAAQGDYSTAPPIELEDLCPLFTSDLCLYLMQCGGSKYRDAEHCESQMHCYGLEQLEESAASGRVDYNPKKVGECHARFVDDPCEFAFFLFTPDIFEVLHECDGTLTANQADGEACISGGECTSGICAMEGQTCPGSCAAVPEVGEPCADGWFCPEGMRCDESDICRPDWKVGDPCTDRCGASISISLGDDGLESEEEVLLYCDQGTGTCQEEARLGEECGAKSDGTESWNIPCAEGWCKMPMVLSESAVCAPLSAPGGECAWVLGCEEGSECVDENSFDDIYGTCVADAGEGESCAGGDIECVEGLICQNEVCVPALPVGAACSVYRECESRRCGAEGTCVKMLFPGDACDSSDGECEESRCVDGTCVRLSRVGESCMADEECATYDCVGGICVDESICSAGQD